MTTAYDELPYKSMPIEWTAPERLALTSLLHGGPRSRLEAYRVLELGCADGANLLPMAFFRRHGTFIGVDSASCQIAMANRRKSDLRLRNVEFVCADFRDADLHLSGEFDFIIAHGVFSWICDAARDALLGLCARRLRSTGLFYLNYNTYPGWKVRGLIRRFMLARADRSASLREQALHAQQIAAQLAVSMGSSDHPYSQLLARELRFVSEHHYSYVAHEYLAAENRAYWRSEFLQRVRSHGFEYVADADFSYPSGRVSAEPLPQSVRDGLSELDIPDTMDLLSYRQLHSPLLGLGRSPSLPATVQEFADLTVASCLSRCAPEATQEHMFQHPSGYKVETREACLELALTRLRAHWPAGLRIGDLFDDVASVMDDLKLLQRNGLIELRCCDPSEDLGPSEPLNRMEAEWGDYVTTPYHTREAVPSQWMLPARAAAESHSSI